MLKKMFGPKGYEGMEGWKKLQNEEIHKLYSSQCQNKMPL
jgi:hypothetical protein